MENDILHTIISVEREIQERLAAEEEQASQMLDRLQNELDEAARREEERLAASLLQSVARARLSAREQGEALLQAAAAKAQRLDRLDDQTLERFIGKRLGSLVPERGK